MTVSITGVLPPLEENLVPSAEQDVHRRDHLMSCRHSGNCRPERSGLADARQLGFSPNLVLPENLRTASIFLRRQSDYTSVTGRSINPGGCVVDDGVREVTRRPQGPDEAGIR